MCADTQPHHTHHFSPPGASSGGRGEAFPEQPAKHLILLVIRWPIVVHHPPQPLGPPGQAALPRPEPSTLPTNDAQDACLGGYGARADWSR